MLPIPAKLKFVLGVVFAGAIASLQFVLKSPEGSAWTWIAPSLAALVWLEGFFTTPPAASKQIAEHAATIAKLTGAAVLVLGLGALVVTTTACPQAVPVVGPVASCVDNVVADALAGLTIDQIVAKEKGECVKDAEQVIAILLGQLSAQVKATPAYAEARRVRAQREGTAP